MCLRQPRDWFDVFVPAADRLWSGECFIRTATSIRRSGVFRGNLSGDARPDKSAGLVWHHVLALGDGGARAWSLAEAGRVEPTTKSTRKPMRSRSWALLCGIFFAFDTLTNQQNDLILAALLIGGCQSVAAWPGPVGGAAVWACRALKCTPSLWSGYFLWCRQWLASFVVVAGAIGFNLLPDISWPPPQPKTSARRMGDAIPDRPGKPAMRAFGYIAINFNHSIAGVVRRLVLFHPTWHGADMDIAAGPVVQALSRSRRWSTASDWPWLRWPCWRAGDLDSDWRAGGVSPLVQYSSKPGGLRPPLANSTTRRSAIFAGFHADAAAVADVEQAALLHAVSSGLLPGEVGVERLIWWLDSCLVQPSSAALVSNKDLVGERVYDFVIWYGSVFWSCLLLFAGCCYALFVEPRAMAKDSASLS